MGVHAAKAKRKRREMVAALGIMAEYFPEEPLYSLMLLDHLLPQKKYEEGMAALQRLAEKLEVEDAAMEARLSAISLALGNDEDADRYADQAITREPGLELGWLSAFTARASLSDFAGTVDAAATLRADFDRDLDPETLGKNPAFAQLLSRRFYRQASCGRHRPYFSRRPDARNGPGDLGGDNSGEPTRGYLDAGEQ